MYERCLQEAENFLASHSKVVVPVQEVWEQIVKLSQQRKFDAASLPDFTALLEGDRRFELMVDEKSTDELQGKLFEEEEGGEMEQLGFFSRDSVKLRRIKLVREDEEVEDSTKNVVKGIGSTLKNHIIHIKPNGKLKTTRRQRTSTRKRKPAKAPPQPKNRTKPRMRKSSKKTHARRGR